jgi:hypothetical protein
MSDKADLYRMLRHARPAHPYQELNVKEGMGWITVTTGPDDAGAAFVFGPSGELLSVSVVEAHVGQEISG